MATPLSPAVKRLLQDARQDYETAHTTYVTPDWGPDEWWERDTRAQKLVNLFGHFCDGDFTTPYFTTLFHIALPAFPNQSVEQHALEERAARLQQQFELTDQERDNWIARKIKHLKRPPAEFGVWAQSERDIVENGLFLEKLHTYVSSRRDGKWHGDSLSQAALPNELCVVASVGDVQLYGKYIPYMDTATQEQHTHSIMYDAVRTADKQLTVPIDGLIE